jgi:hypothetical protein
MLLLLLSWVPCRERAGRMMVGVFGAQVMEDYWDSMAGDPRIRL